MDLFLPLFAVLLVAYSAVSLWLRLDYRYPIVGAILLLVAAGGVDAAGDHGTAATLATFTVLLLLAGIVLGVVEEGRRPPAPPASLPSAPAEGVETADER
ncbi:MAG TPA: hypothetical protein VMH78_08615 [Thermoplasmata archaeon]|nr:hypothetical protein [Thermoplasmata archaeon]